MNLPPALPSPLQDRLDVTQKTRANPFNWRGQFTPELIEYLLDEFDSGGLVADPFSGSGTVLLESARQGLPCCGLEINPAAFAMSKFYTLCNVESDARCEILAAVEAHLRVAINSMRTPISLGQGASHRERNQDLVEFTRAFIPVLKRGIEKIVALNLLFICESRRSRDLGTSLLVAFHVVEGAALALPFSHGQVSAHLCDARRMHTLPQVRPRLIITSPPYINVFNYHQNYRAIMEAVGWDLLKVASSEFGANRKHRANRFKTVIQYCLDMEEAIRSFWYCLEAGGSLILIIGRESNVRGAPFFNGEIVKDIADGLQAFEPARCYERKFLNKFGVTIKEDILLLRKRERAPMDLDVRRIATTHLSRAFTLAAPDVRQDITAAILECAAVHPSAIFQTRGAYSFAANAT